MGFKEYFIGLTLAGLFILATFQMVIGTIDNNQGNVSLIDNIQMNKTFHELNESLSGFETISQEQRTNYESELPNQDFFGTLIIFAVISSVRVFTSLAINTYNITLEPLVSIIGISPMVLGVISSIVLFIGILFGWRMIKTGT